MHRKLDRSQTRYGNSRDEKNFLPLPAIKPRYVQKGLESLGNGLGKLGERAWKAWGTRLERLGTGLESLWNGLGKLYATDCEGLTI